MIMVAGLLIALFMLFSAVAASLVIICCAPRSRPPAAMAPAMGPVWAGVQYGQSWNSSGIRQRVHMLPGSVPNWPSPWVGPAYRADPGSAAAAAGSAAASPEQIKQRRQLSGVGRHVIVHGVRR